MVGNYSAYRRGSDTVPPDVIDRILLGACVLVMTAATDAEEPRPVEPPIRRSSALDAYRERQRLEVESFRMDTADTLRRLREELDRDIDRLG